MAQDPEERRLLLGKLIRRDRISRGWSVEEASRHAGISRATWTNAEDGRALRDSKLGSVEVALGWATGSVGDILSGTAEEPRKSQGVPDDAVPVGNGVQPVDISDLSPEDQEYIRSLAERLRRQRGE